MKLTLAEAHDQDDANGEDDYVEALVPEAFVGEVEASGEPPSHQVDWEVGHGVGAGA